MSEELDKMLNDMNESMHGRMESDIPLDDDYWKKRNAYQRGLHAVDGVHVPVAQQTELSEGPKNEEVKGEETSEDIQPKGKVKSAKDQLKGIGH